jgi:hypothetical protein
VPEEATLDAFAGEADASTTDADEATAGAEDEGGRHAGEAEDSGSLEAAPVTSSWTGADGACSSCGEPAGRLWADGGERVCSGCKQW